MFKILIIILGLMISITSLAQKGKKDRRDDIRRRNNALAKQEEDGVIAYRKQIVFGGKLINDGYGIFFEIGKATTVSKSMLFQLELSERKSPREEKLTNTQNYAAPLIYGKQNFIYPVKLGAQQQILFGNKSNKNGVSVTGNFGGGLALSLVRPYYVQLGTTGKYVKYESPDSVSFLTPSDISAGPGFSKGWNDLKIVPGAYVKTALRFDYGSYNEIVSAIEVGISAEYYSKKIPILVKSNPKAFFFSGYVALIFGKRK